MPNLPSTRQNRDSEIHSRSHIADPRLLVRAFETFTEAAGSLEKSYAHLQEEVSRLRADLANANAKLSHSLDENARVRSFLTLVLDKLPCGVVVSRSDSSIRLLNPEARRLLELDSQSLTHTLLPVFKEWDSLATSEKSYIEYEWPSSLSPEKRTLAITAAALETFPDAGPETIWILRDNSDQKRYAAEREESRRTHALAVLGVEQLLVRCSEARIRHLGRGLHRGDMHGGHAAQHLGDVLQHLGLVRRTFRWCRRLRGRLSRGRFRHVLGRSFLGAKARVVAARVPAHRAHAVEDGTAHAVVRERAEGRALFGIVFVRGFDQSLGPVRDQIAGLHGLAELPAQLGSDRVHQMQVLLYKLIPRRSHHIID